MACQLWEELGLYAFLDYALGTESANVGQTSSLLNANYPSANVKTFKCDNISAPLCSGTLNSQ